MIRPATALIVTAVLAGGCSPQGGTRTVDPQAAADAASTITPVDVYERIAFLASDDMRGRDTPSPELDAAARWIADQLAAAGAEPAGEDGWIQRYPYPSEALDAREVRLEISQGATHSLEYGTEFYVWPGADVEAGPAVYAGPTLEPAGDLDGRVVLLRLDDLPEAGRRGLDWPRRTRDDIRAALDRLADAGAAAALFVLAERVTPGELGALAEVAEAPSRTLGGRGADGPVAAFITRSAARRLFRMGGLDAGEILARPGLDRPIPLEGVTVRLRAPVRELDDAAPPNVVGVLRGGDPELRDSYVVVSAHMDGVGVGRPDESGDSIYNGADDDASGVAVMLEVAEALGSLPEPPRRSVLFVAVSGEEKGLLGSRWFSDHPTVPVDDMVANVNIDMVGRNAADSIVVIGQEYSSLGTTAREVAGAHPEIGLTLSEDLWPQERFFFRSDHFNFARREVPALFFFAGTHEDYHGPGDEVDDIDTEKTARVGRLIFFLTYRLADDAEAPRWDPDGLEEVRRLTGG
jgi:hypothetical protein